MSDLALRLTADVLVTLTVMCVITWLASLVVNSDRHHK
jgi:hypothetical protein